MDIQERFNLEPHAFEMQSDWHYITPTNIIRAEIIIYVWVVCRDILQVGRHASSLPCHACLY